MGERAGEGVPEMKPLWSWTPDRRWPMWAWVVRFLGFVAIAAVEADVLWKIVR
jgi:hypothetical protein